MANRAINKEIESTLNSLDGMEKAKASDLFYEKVMLRIERKEARVISLTPRVVWQAAACLALLVVLNVWVCMRFNTNESGQAQNKSNPVAEEYFSYLKTSQF